MIHVAVHLITLIIQLHAELSNINSRPEIRQTRLTIRSFLCPPLPVVFPSELWELAVSKAQNRFPTQGGIENSLMLTYNIFIYTYFTLIWVKMCLQNAQNKLSRKKANVIT